MTDRSPPAPAATSPAVGAIPPLYLVACSSAKLTRRAVAAELYTSDLFRASRDYAEALANLHGSAWAILSARYGLLDPEDIVEPYNVNLADLSGHLRYQWSARVCAALEDLAGGSRPLVVLAGRTYSDALRHQRPRWSWEEPLRGLMIGERRRWLRANLPMRPLPLFDGISSR